MALHQDAARLLVESMPVIPLWYGTIIAGYSINIDDVRITPFQTLDLHSIATR